jgi:phosphatidylglycerophosphate synthase
MHQIQLGPADRVTASRAALSAGVAALVIDGFFGGTFFGGNHTPILVTLASIALALDLLDGYVARRTGTATPFGARFDLEVDAFLIAVLSVHVARTFGWWVLLIGAMRYLYVAAAAFLPWLRLPLPPRRSAKVIAAIQGVTLAVAASGLLPNGLVRVALAIALLLLIESFGQDCWAQWRRRAEADRVERPDLTGRTWVTVLAVVMLWFALVHPSLADGIGPADLLRIPLEGLALVGLALIVPPAARRILGVAAGLALAVLAVLRLVDLGFTLVLARDFHLLGDLPNIRNGFQLVHDTEGPVTAAVTIGVVLVATAALFVVVPWAALRVLRAARERRSESLAILTVLGVVWVACAFAAGPVQSLATARAMGLVRATVDQVHTDQRESLDFGDALRTDGYAGKSGKQLVGALAGKDVLFIWFESYGRTALEGPMSPGVLDVIASSNRTLSKAGYQARSAFLTSPVVGAGSWLAHGSVQSGVWVDGEQRYGQLLASDRLSLTRAFEKGGWRTVFVVPANTEDWPEGAKYYGFDKLYDSRNVGYRGPKFGYASMPDQYTLEHFRRTELERHKRPIFGELDLVSSHYRWGKLPDLIDWKDVGDGRVFRPMAKRGSAIDGRRDPKTSSRLYGRSVEYTWRAIASFLTTYPDRNRVVIVAGDHQPHQFVGGVGDNRDAPVTIIAQDPDVIRRISGWHWQRGLRPKPDAPVWRMDTFRNHFFRAYGTGNWLTLGQ